MDISTGETTLKKVRENNVDSSTIEIKSKKYVETTWIFRPSKYIEKSTLKKRELFDRRNYIEKSTWKQ